MSEFLFTTAGSVVHSAGSPVSGGSFSVTSSPSTKIKAAGSFVYDGPTISVTFSGGNMAGMVPGSVQGSGVITATATKCLEASQPIMRDKDSGTLVGTGQPTGGGPPTPVTISCECSESQTKVKGE